MGNEKYYVVLVGRRPEIYMCWDDARLEVEEYSGAIHRAFRNWKEVVAFWDGNSDKARASSRPRMDSHAVQFATFSDDLDICHLLSSSIRRTVQAAQVTLAMVSKAVSIDDLPPSDREIFCAILVSFCVLFLAFFVIFKF